MKLIMENWNDFLEKPAKDIEPLLAAIAKKIKKIKKTPIDPLNLSEEGFKELIVRVYEEHYDKTKEGWNPYDQDIKYIKNILQGGPDPEEEDDELAPDDYKDPPGHMPGDNKRW